MIIGVNKIKDLEFNLLSVSKNLQEINLLYLQQNITIQELVLKLES